MSFRSVKSDFFVSSSFLVVKENMKKIKGMDMDSTKSKENSYRRKIKKMGLDRRKIKKMGIEKIKKMERKRTKTKKKKKMTMIKIK